MYMWGESGALVNPFAMIGSAIRTPTAGMAHTTYALRNPHSREGITLSRKNQGSSQESREAQNSLSGHHIANEFTKWISSETTAATRTTPSKPMSSLLALPQCGIPVQVRITKLAADVRREVLNGD
ncbi:hypothetical protein BASA62_010423 [Batrachochytrium salamandrivorans]|nr:hypothetical protein BASA62_010423 [Batrachochytrium salamandrivorans]